ncbi:hypothetical protein FDP41_003732 [Naegleria fowleri]|uniref:Uncharacterized protein n=1 Tax=Naegleria fowleri TaxID=5763 RepID=A0A6A5BVW9_NAEFO|nr:uncharacterized protein FDP41_003732 [Naegleria fowleri]KAF0977079.1 hypothetical protein FDP41_003732 [Naegleria fowleri]
MAPKKNLSLTKPLSTQQLHKEQIKQALQGATEEEKKSLFQKKKDHIQRYHTEVLDRIKPFKKPFNQKVHVPLVPKKDDLETLQDEELDFDQVMRDYILSECSFDEENKAGFFLDDADPDFKKAVTGIENVEVDPSYEYDQEPIEEEVYSAKTLSKLQAIKAFTGKDEKLFAKQFKFISTGYYKTAIAEAMSASTVSHIQLEKSEVMETIKQLKTYDQAITQPGEGLLFSEQDPSLVFFISVYMKNPYLHSISAPVDVPFLKPILSFSKEQLPFSSLQMLLLVQDDQYDAYTQTLKDCEFITKLKIMKLSDLMVEIGTTYLKGNTFENTRFGRFNDKKHFLNQYDLLFCDATLSRKVSALFNSYKKRKQGVRPVTLDNVLGWINNDLTHSKAFIVQGNSHFTIRIARTEWNDKDIFANVSHFLENKTNNAEVRTAFSQLVQSDIRMVMLHTNRSIYVKIYENVDIDMDKAKTFKAEKKWRSRGKKEETLQEEAATTHASLIQPTSTPKKAVMTPRKSEIATPARVVGNSSSDETSAPLTTSTPKKLTSSITKKQATAESATNNNKQTEEAIATPKKKDNVQPTSAKKQGPLSANPEEVTTSTAAVTTPKSDVPSSTTNEEPKKNNASTPKKQHMNEDTQTRVLSSAQKKTKKQDVVATPKRSISDLKSKLSSLQPKKSE